jgi:hypothetical protein
MQADTIRSHARKKLPANHDAPIEQPRKVQEQSFATVRDEQRGVLYWKVWHIRCSTEALIENQRHLELMIADE